MEHTPEKNIVCSMGYNWKYNMCYTVANDLRTVKIFAVNFFFGNSDFKWDVTGAIITKLYVFLIKDSSDVSWQWLKIIQWFSFFSVGRSSIIEALSVCKCWSVPALTSDGWATHNGSGDQLFSGWKKVLFPFFQYVYVTYTHTVGWHTPALECTHRQPCPNLHVCTYTHCTVSV